MQATDFPSYRILFPEKAKLPVVGSIPFVPKIDIIVFDVEIKAGGGSTELNGEPLRRRYGPRWPDELKREVGRGLLTIFGMDARRVPHELGLDADGELTVKPPYVLAVPDTEPGHDAESVAAPSIDSDVASMNAALAASARKPVNREVAVHLLQHLKRGPRHCVAVVDGLVGLGWSALRLREPDKFAHLEQHVKNGPSRRPCRFCNS